MLKEGHQHLVKTLHLNPPKTPLLRGFGLKVYKILFIHPIKIHDFEGQATKKLDKQNRGLLKLRVIMTDLKTSVFLTEKDIANQVSRTATALNKRFQNKTVTAIGVLKGAFTFYTDLLRKMKFETVCDFCATSSYGDSHIPSSEVRLLLDISTPIHGRDVLLVEDIVDRGLTLSFLQSLFRGRNPKSLTTVALIHKQDQKGPPVQVDYSCFSLKTSSFLVGYGMDYQEKFRHLPHIAQINSFN